MKASLNSPRALLLTSPLCSVQHAVPFLQPDRACDVVGLQQFAEGALLTVLGLKEQLGKVLLTEPASLPPVQSSAHVFIRVPRGLNRDGSKAWRETHTAWGNRQPVQPRVKITAS